ncbi:hypothetical protein D7V21_15600, partial [Acinetobacter guerrae]
YYQYCAAWFFAVAIIYFHIRKGTSLNLVILNFIFSVKQNFKYKSIIYKEFLNLKKDVKIKN